MNYRYLQVSLGQSWAELHIHRPERRNAMTAAAWQELAAAVDDLAGRPGVRSLIITGSGAAFVAGSDLDELAARTPEGALAALAQAAVVRIATAPVPTIAAVNGPALGGGCEIALACDLRIGSTAARLGQPELQFAIIPGAGATQRLPRLVGPARAAELVLTGTILDATAAERIGLLNRVVAPDELLPAARELAARLGALSQTAVQMALTALRAAGGYEPQGLLVERLAQAVCFAHPDRAEALRAWREQRPPRFSGPGAQTGEGGGAR